MRHLCRMCACDLQYHNCVFTLACVSSFSNLGLTVAQQLPRDLLTSRLHPLQRSIRRSTTASWTSAMAPSLTFRVYGHDLRRLAQQNGWPEEAITAAIEGLAAFDMSATCPKAQEISKETGRCVFTDIDNWVMTVTVKSKITRRF